MRQNAFNMPDKPYKNFLEDLYEYKIKGIYFNSKWNKNNSVTYSGLELADLCTYPIHKEE